MEKNPTRKPKKNGITFDESMDNCLKREVRNYQNENNISDNSQIDWGVILINFLNSYQGGSVQQESITAKKLKDRYFNYLLPFINFTNLTEQELRFLSVLVSQPKFQKNNKILWKYIAIVFSKYTGQCRTGSFLKNQYNKYKIHKETKKKSRNTRSGPRHF